MASTLKCLYSKVSTKISGLTSFSDVFGVVRDVGARHLLGEDTLSCQLGYKALHSLSWS